MFRIFPTYSAALLWLALAASPLLASNAVIRFDLPPTVAAQPTRCDRYGDSMVECQLRISSLIASPNSPQIDQWLVICQPRDPAMEIIDYCPRTDAQSDIQGPIEVKAIDESNASMGLSIDGNYGNVVRANIGADKGNKKTNSQQYSLAAPHQAVTASGTINRGRGVYFKLRRSARQILEGEKTFKLTFRVPHQWRGSLIDVSVHAQSERSTLAGLDKQVKTMGRSIFVVAAYRAGDEEAASISHQLADAEQSLRHLAQQLETEHQATSLSTILTRVAIKLDLQSAKTDNEWFWRLLAGEADPYLDKQIRRLPMNVRLAVLDYCEIREDFDQLAKPAIAETCNQVASQGRSTLDNADR